ncbi:9959_t:CDS:2 [Cetraspora pellucida]|uniref:9959_t:CDS:1 n=1 Tax=Cetraspora pellucida TaxID=1433469 RepID=A0ACA9L5G6_9GLOM|nr:9959_t:CDS:2 [Cetraspora pellucida]
MSEHIEEDIYPTTLLTIKTYDDIYYNTQTTEDAIKFFEDLINMKISENGKIVEIDESKFKKWKYNKGKRVEEQ